MKKKNIIIIFDKFLYFFMKVVSKLCKNNLLTIFPKTLVKMIIYFKKNFDIIFIGNKKSCQNINFFFP